MAHIPYSKLWVGQDMLPRASEMSHHAFATRRNALLLLVAFIGLCEGANARTRQERAIIPNEEMCPDCSVTLEHSVTLGGALGETPIGPSGFVRRDSRGNYYLSNLLDPGVVYVLDDEGSPIQTIGHLGDEPGAFRYVRWLYVDGGDSLHIIDHLTERYTLLSPNYSVVRVVNFPGRPVSDSYAPLPHGGGVINASMNTPATAGFPFHRLDARGVVTASHGPGDFVGIDMLQTNIIRPVATAGPSGFWAAYQSKYEIELWDVRGVRRNVLVRAPEWFPSEPVPRGALSPERPPRPILKAVRNDAQGRLIVIIEVADARWSESLSASDGIEGTTYLPVEERLAYDTIIEVIDPVSARLVKSERHDAHIVGFVDDQHLYGYRHRSADGVVRYDVWGFKVGY